MKELNEPDVANRTTTVAYRRIVTPQRTRLPTGGTVRGIGAGCTPAAAVGFVGSLSTASWGRGDGFENTSSFSGAASRFSRQRHLVLKRTRRRSVATAAWGRRGGFEDMLVIVQ